jgi:drug/metabolite transporter (DMT)-like permease
MQKLLFVLIAVSVNFAMQWYAHGAGKLPDAGVLLGWHYNSAIISSTIQTLKYIWFFVLANVAFTYAFKIGETSFDTFLITMILWIASAPVAALLYNIFVLKQPLNWLYGVGILLVFAGSVCVAANQEVLDLIKK